MGEIKVLDLYDDYRLRQHPGGGFTIDFWNDSMSYTVLETNDKQKAKDKFKEIMNKNI